MPLPAVFTKLAEVNTLPSAEVQSAVGNGNGKAHAEERALGVGRHVISSFQGMVIIRFVLPYHVVEYLLHITAHVWIGILVDGERT